MAHKTSRRIFMRIAGLLGLLSIMPAAWSQPTSEDHGQNPTTRKLLTKDGKLVEVDVKHMPTPTGRRRTNKELRKWMSTGHSGHTAHDTKQATRGK